MAAYKLYYFNGMGRAEVTRLLFALGDVDYEDKRLPREEWPELKPKTPFGQLPVLDVNGEQICQGKAMEFYVAKQIGRLGKTDLDQARCLMIMDCCEDTLKPLYKLFSIKDEAEKKEAREKYCRDELPGFLEKFEKLLSNSSSGVFVGDDLSLADLAVFQLVTALPVFDYMTVDLTNFTRLTALVQKVKSNPKIGAWLEKRPKTPF